MNKRTNSIHKTIISGISDLWFVIGDWRKREQMQKENEEQAGAGEVLGLGGGKPRPYGILGNAHTSD
jgi:hypothetical protein